jgi:hypothetical protein
MSLMPSLSESRTGAAAPPPDYTVSYING